MKFHGVVRATGSGVPGMESGGAPAIDIQVEILGRVAQVQFEIDTGAAVTVLSDGDASRLLGVEHRLLDFHADAQRIGLQGLAGLTAGNMLEARLTLSTDEGQLRLVQPIVIPPPTDRIAPRSLPSLLGRDVLRHFRFELSYGDAPSVLLETL